MWKGILLFSCLTALIAPNSTFGQTIPRDSSFTVIGTFEKELKKFPQIRIAEVSEDNINIQKDIAYKTLPYRDLTLDVFQPKAHKKDIAILLIHGGGWRTGDKTHMHEMSKALANKGYTCFAVEHRLSLEAPYPAAVMDVQDAIAWIKQNSLSYKIHPNKVFCLGTSSGGQIAALVGALNTSILTEEQKDTKVAGVIDIDGLLSFTHPDAQEGTMAAQWLGGDRTVAEKNWKEASALENIHLQSSPMLFITSSYKRFSAGKNDLITKYKEWNIPCEELNFENSPHTFWYFHPWFTPTIEKIDSFISGLIQ